MWIFAFLSSRFPGPIARLLTGLWYAILIVLALIFSFEPQADFRYGNI